MSTMSKLKVKVGYDKDTPRCENCEYLKKTFVRMETHKNPRHVLHWSCKQMGFNVTPAGLCNKWVGRADGAVLDL